jgi:hypothetical protein
MEDTCEIRCLLRGVACRLQARCRRSAGGYGNLQSMKCRKEPCPECPWVKRTEPDQFPRRNYEQLRNTTGTPGKEVGLDAPLFACHKSQEGKEVPCAGWLAAVGYLSLKVRLLVSHGEIPVEALHSDPNWPELHESFEEMMAAKAGADDCDLIALAEGDS